MFTELLFFLKLVEAAEICHEQKWKDRTRRSVFPVERETCRKKRPNQRGWPLIAKVHTTMLQLM